MKELEKVGWKKSQDKSVDDITNSDIKDVFLMVDLDNSGEVSRTVRLEFSTKNKYLYLRRLGLLLSFWKKDLALQM